LFRGRKSYKTALVKVSFVDRHKDYWAPRVEEEFCLEGGCSACVV
jgi:hypothetical protein